MSTIEERVTQLIAQQAREPAESILPTMNFRDDLACDSLDEIEIVMALEVEFEIEISDEDAERWVTVHDIVAYVTDKTA